MNCDYHIDDSFQNNISNNTNCSNKMSLFHINIKSLPKHFDDLDLYLNSLDYTFSFDGLTETWLDECKHDLIDLPGPRLNIKTVLSTYGDFHVKDKTAVRTSYL